MSYDAISIMFRIVLFVIVVFNFPVDALAEDGSTNFPNKVFGTVETYGQVKATHSARFCRLSGETQSRYIKKGRLTADYPVVVSTVTLDQKDVKTLLAIITNRNSYRFGGKYGVGFPRWDRMLVLMSDQGQVEVLIWRTPGMVRVVKDRQVLGAGTLKEDVQKKFALFCDKLLAKHPAEETKAITDKPQSPSLAVGVKPKVPIKIGGE